MKRAKVSITLIGAALVVGAGLLSVVLIPAFIAESAALPFQTMRLTFADDDGVATMHGDAFHIAFAGHSFGDRSWGGNYLVDGRYGFRMFPGPDAASGEIGGGVFEEYSQRRRLLTLRYQGHVIAYSHARNTITVDGRDFSTAERPVRLLIKANGDAVQLGD